MNITFDSNIDENNKEIRVEIQIINFILKKLYRLYNIFKIKYSKLNVEQIIIQYHNFKINLSNQICFIISILNNY